MDFYFLNFKQVLVILTAKNMRENLLQFIEENEIDVNLKFVDSYKRAFELISQKEFDPYDHIILNTSKNNQKCRDFLEYIQPQIDLNPKYLIEYTNDSKLIVSN